MLMQGVCQDRMLTVGKKSARDDVVWGGEGSVNPPNKSTHPYLLEYAKQVLLTHLFSS